VGWFIQLLGDFGRRGNKSLLKTTKKTPVVVCTEQTLWSFCSVRRSRCIAFSDVLIYDVDEFCGRSVSPWSSSRLMLEQDIEGKKEKAKDEDIMPDKPCNKVQFRP
jgi:hypothetical protein